MKFLLALLLTILFSVTACSRTPVKIARVGTGTSVSEKSEELDLSDDSEDEYEYEGAGEVIVEATSSPTPVPQVVVTVPAPAISTRPVYRSMNVPSGARYWTAEWSNIEYAAANYNHVYEGVAFKVATSPQGPCNIPLYSCLYAPTQMYHFSTDVGCGHPRSKVVESLGYACHPNSGVATEQVTMFVHPNSWQFFTASAYEGNWAVKYGFSPYGAFYTPQ